MPSSIAVTKTASTATVVYPGGDVTFTVTVTNTSLVDAVTITSLTDNLHGDAANGDSLDGVGDCALPGAGLVLAAANDGDTDTYTCSYTVAITGDPGETFTDRAPRGTMTTGTRSAPETQRRCRLRPSVFSSLRVTPSTTWTRTTPATCSRRSSWMPKVIP